MVLALVSPKYCPDILTLKHIAIIYLKFTFNGESCIFICHIWQRLGMDLHFRKIALAAESGIDQRVRGERKINTEMRNAYPPLLK